MNRRWLLAFPPEWRDRFGDELVDQVDADPRRVAKWVDLVRTAAGLRWDAVTANGDTATVLLVLSLALVLGADVALGVGMDERIDAHLAAHWWGAPFLALLAAAAVAAVAGLAAVAGTPHGRRLLVRMTAAVALGSLAGSAAGAAVSIDLAGPGAGAGLVVSVAVLRALTRGRLRAMDGLVAAAAPMVVLLGWRSAGTPVGPAVLLLVTGALLASRVPERPAAA